MVLWRFCICESATVPSHGVKHSSEVTLTVLFPREKDDPSVVFNIMSMRETVSEPPISARASSPFGGIPLVLAFRSLQLERLEVKGISHSTRPLIIHVTVNWVLLPPQHGGKHPYRKSSQSLADCPSAVMSSSIGTIITELFRI